MMTEKLSIAKLRGAENYAAWSADIRLILRRDKNWSLIDEVGTKPPPTHVPDPSFMLSPHGAATQPPMTPNPDYEK